jgi:broad specificity phosphatase PhoE
LISMNKGPADAEKCRMVLVRHGETDFNSQSKFIGSIDVPLNSKGLAQVSFLSRRMEAIPFDLIITSPYKRARQTAEGLRCGRNIEIREDAGFREICCGEWEGLTTTEVEKRWPDLLHLWNFAPDKLVIPGGDSLQKVSETIYAAFWRTARASFGKTVGVASHMISIVLLLMRLSGEEIAKIWEQTPIDNTSVSIVDVFPSGQCEILAWGDNSHLPPELRVGASMVAGRMDQG